ncbi:hypothetical protein KDK77_05430, partial [bacterium]|nr:hypothetical protein [bacterium]
MKQLKNWQIKTKLLVITLSLIIITVITCCLFSYLTFSFTQKAIYKEIEEKLVTQINQYKKTLEFRLNRANQ